MYGVPNMTQKLKTKCLGNILFAARPELTDFDDSKYRGKIN
jgi:hypothetical protein